MKKIFLRPRIGKKPVITRELHRSFTCVLLIVFLQVGVTLVMRTGKLGLKMQNWRLLMSQAILYLV